MANIEPSTGQVLLHKHKEGVSKALDNLASVAINTSLISDTDSTDDLGSSSKYWANTYTDKVYLNSTAALDGTVAGQVTITGGISVSGLASNLAQGGASPKDHNVLAWTYDPALAQNSDLLGTAGTIYTIRIYIPYNMSITNIIMNVGTNGNTLTNSYAALYQNNILLGKTADQSTAWSSGSSTKTMALVGGPYSVTAGSVEVAIWCGSWVTAPKFLRNSSQSSGMANLGLSAANSRYATADTGITTTPPDNLGTHTQTAITWWAALS